jgi:hypothetical protein
LEGRKRRDSSTLKKAEGMEPRMARSPQMLFSSVCFEGFGLRF